VPKSPFFWRQADALGGLPTQTIICAVYPRSHRGSAPIYARARSREEDANETSPPQILASGSGCCRAPGRVADGEGADLSCATRAELFGQLLCHEAAKHIGRTTGRVWNDRQFYVENIGGAGGNVRMGHGAKAAPDGYTILVVAPTIVINPALYDKVPFDPYKDFDPVTLAVTSPDVLSVNPSLPVETVKDLVALIKANPGKYNFASPGTGTPGHLVGELFRLSLGLDLVHIPFNSAGLAIGSTIAGHTPIAFTAPPPVIPQVKEGKLRALAVASKTRSQALPDVPTMAEAGYPDIEGEAWFRRGRPGQDPQGNRHTAPS
jgi:hypothetical protein